MTEESPQELLDLLVLQEETVGRLYQQYKANLPPDELWDRLVKEESNHANWLRALGQEERAVLNEKRFPIEAVQSMIDYINNSINESSSYDSVKALAVAYDIENALIEKNFFENFKTDSAEIQRIFNDLARETASHRRLIKEKLDEVRSS